MVWLGGALAVGALAFVLGRWSLSTSGRKEPTAVPPAASAPAAVTIAPPRFVRLTYQSGAIISARFTPDGHNVVFGGLIGSDALRVHTVRTESPATLALDIAGHVLAVSRSGEMAVSLGRRLVPWPGEGTLARAPLLGGAPRSLLDDVQDADFEADGEDLVVTRRVGGTTRIERPMGTVVFETPGWVSHLRVDPQGERIAFFHHPFPNDTAGKVALAAKDGAVRDLSDTFMDLNGLAWAPSGREVWFSGAAPQGPFEIAAVDLEGKRRRVFQGPGRVVLHDVAADGRVLVTVDDWRGVSVAAQPGAVDRDLSVLDNTVVMDLSADGAQVLLSEQSAGGRPSYDVYLRPASGGPPTLLGEGLASSLSPTGAWVAAVRFGSGSAVDLIPTGPGAKRRVARDGFVFQNAFFLGSDDRLLVVATERGGERRLYALDTTKDAPPDPLSPAGAWREALPRIDGRGAIARNANGEVWLFSPDAAERQGRLVTTLPPQHTLAQPFTQSAVYVLRRGARPGEVLRLDLATGRLEHHATLAPRDLTGFVEASTFAAAKNPDRFAYTYFKLLSTLYVVEGL